MHKEIGGQIHLETGTDLLRIGGSGASRGCGGQLASLVIVWPFTRWVSGETGAYSVSPQSVHI